MHRSVKIFVVMFLGWFSTICNAESISLNMFQGEVKVLGMFEPTRIAIGNGKIVKIEAKPQGELIMIAESAGSTSVRLWLKNGTQAAYNVRVSESDPETRVRMESMIRMKVKMVEVRKNAINELGINWANSINGPALSTAGDFISTGLFRSPDNSGIDGVLPLNVKPFSTHFGLATSITSQINFLASNGDAITLAEPTLSCVNGGSADFLAGGEVPYPMTGSNGQVSVDFKEYGIKLKINPLADEEGNIYAKINTEISQIDAAVSVMGAPGILTRRTVTEVNVVNGQTIVLSGLLSQESSIDKTKLPGLGDIPFLGRLFGSTKSRNQKVELFVFVTPEIVAPHNMALRKGEKRLYDFSNTRQEKINQILDFDLME